MCNVSATLTQHKADCLSPVKSRVPVLIPSTPLLPHPRRFLPGCSSPSGSPRGSRHRPPDPSRGGYPQKTGLGAQGRDGSPMESHLSRSAFYTGSERSRGTGRSPETQRAAPKKEKPARPPPPQSRGREGEGGGLVGTGQWDATQAEPSRAWPEEKKAELEDLWGNEGLRSGFEESSQRGGVATEPQDPWDSQEEVSKPCSLLREDRCPSQPPGRPGRPRGLCVPSSTELRVVAVLCTLGSLIETTIADPELISL